MLPFRRDPAAEALGRYREALAAGASTADLERLAEGLDPDLVATVRWSMMQGRQARPQPDPVFVRDLRRELVRAASVSGASPPTLPSTPLPSIGDDQRGVSSPLPLHRAPPASPPHVLRPRWDWRQFVAAAVLLLIAGAVLLIRSVDVGRPTTEFMAAGAPTVETLIDATIEGAPTGYTPLTIERWRFQPGAELSFPALDGPQWIVADTGPFTATIDGKGQPLAPGEGLIVPAGQTLALHNPGLTEAALLRGVATMGFALSDYDRTLVTKETAFDTEAREALPPGESRLVFERMTVPPGTTLRMETTTGENWFDIVSGHLGLTLAGDTLPPGWVSDRERELAPDEAIPRLVPGTRVWLHNIGDDPLVVLLLRVQADDATKAPG